MNCLEGMPFLDALLDPGGGPGSSSRLVGQAPAPCYAGAAISRGLGLRSWAPSVFSECESRITNRCGPGGAPGDGY
ncbi:hypothetical protein Atai01_71960 [Amycolatopsis taiwanensis]|uniref:Uncharacterized protein n=1 Tax=Amycolatopsis taiwanensis TaxID=342230 RepID=A0A9W6RAJ7_9PSEU|nr:hypothetical protein Atai01_71960 [Amycolatopsis taiwanensis]